MSNFLETDRLVLSAFTAAVTGPVLAVVLARTPN